MLKKTLAIITFFLLAFNAYAGSLEVSPVRINLSNQHKVESLTVQNTSKEKQTLQVSLYQWSQHKTHNVYTRSRALLVLPPIFDLKPGQTQTIRVAALSARHNLKEQAYRMYIKEVPNKVHHKGDALQILLRIGIPIFFAPITVPHAALSWTATETGDQTLTLNADNTGNIHVQVLHLKLDQNKTALYNKKTFAYLLPGSQYHWKLKLVHAITQPAKLTLTAQTDHGPETDTIQIK